MHCLFYSSLQSLRGENSEYEAIGSRVSQLSCVFRHRFHVDVVVEKIAAAWTNHDEDGRSRYVPFDRSESAF